MGKDVLELLSTAMYVDPLAVVREYVQNSVDAIDEACATGVLRDPSAGRIEIQLDVVDRSLRIRDNGIGIQNGNAERILCAFGNSTKRGTNQRGFRGVGRLGGLGYARSVTFRTKSVLDTEVVELRWDCMLLRRLLLDPKFHDRLEDLVRKVVVAKRYESSEFPEHFFEVHMESVVRIGEDRLLNSAIVERYLQQVAPLPMSPTLRFGERIEEFLAAYLPDRTASIYVNGATTPLTRPHTDEFAVSASKSDRFDDLELLVLDGPNAWPAAVGWVLHHGYVGAIRGAPEIRGLRARVGDIQVGDSSILAEVFPEQRFNSWVVGEIHVLDHRLIPNARRDDFETNSALISLKSQLIPVARELGRRCRVSSQIRNRAKQFEHSADKAKQAMDIVEQGVLTKQAANATKRNAAGYLEDLARILDGQMLPQEVKEQLRRQLRRLEKRFSSVNARPLQGDPLAALPPQKQTAYREFIGLLYECASNKAVAKMLVERITARLAAG